MPPQLPAAVQHTFLGTGSVCRAVTPTLSLWQARAISSTPQRQTGQRKIMFGWLRGAGGQLADPLPGSTNYLGAYDRFGQLKRLEGKTLEDYKKQEGRIPPEDGNDLMPFPRNDAFRSQPVTSEELREAVWKEVIINGQSVKTVSARFNIEMNRVGAIVRLKEVEKEWQRKGQMLAKPYANAVLGMLPTTRLRSYKPHESINDLPVHSATVQQIFHPTSESRHFTREDAARVFDETLLPADKRVPHPELIQLAKDGLLGIESREQPATAKHHDEAQESKPAFKKEKSTKVVDTGRWQFQFREISVDDAGRDGRGARGTGWRYGVPHMDRKRGQVKIPTKVI